MRCAPKKEGSRALFQDLSPVPPRFGASGKAAERIGRDRIHGRNFIATCSFWRPRRRIKSVNCRERTACIGSPQYALRLPGRRARAPEPFICAKGSAEHPNGPDIQGTAQTS
jgi:hypothetical protein